MEGHDLNIPEAKSNKQDQNGAPGPDPESSRGSEEPHSAFESGDSMRAALRGPRTERSVSRGRAHVDKSIEATVKNPETGGTARSRKASHMMGIFDPRTGSQSPMPTLVEPNIQIGASRETSKSSSRPTSPVKQEPVSAWSTRRTSREFGDISIPMLRDTSLPASLRDSQAVSPLKPDHDPYFRQQDLIQKADVPSKLLDEVKGVEKSTPRDSQLPVKVLEPERTDDQSSVASSDYQQARPREDEEEHISAAVYYPHPGPSPEEIERFTSPGETSPDLPSQRRPPIHVAERILSSENKALDKLRGAEHIDISVVSKNEKKIFHGNYRPLDEISADRQTPAFSPLDEAPSSAVLTTSESEAESGDEAGQQSLAEDISTTPTQLSTLSRRPTEVHVPNTRAKVVLEPYKHQVGGHSTIFRFSRRAVCKQLNNRENEFYERIEQRHPDMLKFLPRYVLRSCDCFAFRRQIFEAS